MNHSRFALSLGVTSALLGLVLFYWHSNDGWANSASFSLLYTLFMIGFSTIAYITGISASNHPSPNTLTRLMLLLIIIKLFGSIAIAIAYFESKGGTDKQFVWPFLLIYLVYTIFEMHWLNQINSQTSRLS